MTHRHLTLALLAASLLTGCMNDSAMTSAVEGGAKLTPAQREAGRQELLALRDRTLADLYKAKPETRQEIGKAVGYAVIGAEGLNVVLLVGAQGQGVIVDKRTGKETFIRMLRAGTGPGLGYMRYRNVLVFKNAEVLEQFLQLGVDVGAQGNAVVKPGGAGSSADAMLSFTPYLSIYNLTDSGVNVQANWGGTKYLLDPDLN